MAELDHSKMWLTSDGQWGVIDGDTVQNMETGERVRFAGIDTPETAKDFKGTWHDAYSREAKEELYLRLEDATRRGTLRFEATGEQGVHGRSIGRFYDGDTNLSAELIRKGLARTRYGGENEQEAAQHVYLKTNEAPMDVYQDSNPIYSEPEFRLRRIRDNGAFAKAWDRGIDQFALGMGALLDDAEMMEKYQARLQANSRYVNSYKDIDGVGKAFTYVVETLGEEAPMLLGDAAIAAVGTATTGLGGVVAVGTRRGAVAAVSHSLKSKIGDQISDELIDGVSAKIVDQRLKAKLQADLARKRGESLTEGNVELAMARYKDEVGKVQAEVGKQYAKFGAKAGLGASLTTQMAGENALAFEQEGVKWYDHLPEFLGATAGGAALDYVGLRTAVGRIIKSTDDKAIDSAGAFASKALKEMGITSSTEGATEALQTALTYYASKTAAGKPMSWDELRPQMAEAAVAGATLGGVFGAGTTGISTAASYFDRNSQSVNNSARDQHVNTSFTPETVDNLRAQVNDLLDPNTQSPNNGVLFSSTQKQEFDTIVRQAEVDAYKKGVEPPNAEWSDEHGGIVTHADNYGLIQEFRANPTAAHAKAFNANKNIADLNPETTQVVQSTNDQGQVLRDEAVDGSNVQQVVDQALDAGRNVDVKSPEQVVAEREQAVQTPQNDMQTVVQQALQEVQNAPIDSGNSVGGTVDGVNDAQREPNPYTQEMAQNVVDRLSAKQDQGTDEGDQLDFGFPTPDRQPAAPQQPASPQQPVAPQQPAPEQLPLDFDPQKMAEEVIARNNPTAAPETNDPLDNAVTAVDQVDANETLTGDAVRNQEEKDAAVDSEFLPADKDNYNKSPMGKWFHRLNRGQKTRLSKVIGKKYPSFFDNLKFHDFGNHASPPLGLAYNRTVFLHESLSNAPASIRARVLAHEIGHLAHTDLNAEFNDPNLRSEYVAIKNAIYEESDFDNVSPRDIKYVLSKEELIAEFNVYRLAVGKDQANSIAPNINALLTKHEAIAVQGTSEYKSDKRNVHIVDKETEVVEPSAPKPRNEPKTEPTRTQPMSEFEDATEAEGEHYKYDQTNLTYDQATLDLADKYYNDYAGYVRQLAADYKKSIQGKFTTRPTSIFDIDQPPFASGIFEYVKGSYDKVNHTALSLASAKAQTERKARPDLHDIRREVYNSLPKEGGEQASSNAQQSQQELPRKKRDWRKDIDPSTDDLELAIAKLGGFNREDAISHGIDPAHFKRQVGGINYVFRKAGLKAGEIAESLAQDGMNYLESDNVDELLAKLNLSLSGTPQYSTYGMDKVAEAQYADYEDAQRQQYEDESSEKTWDLDIDYPDFDQARFPSRDMFEDYETVDPITDAEIDEYQRQVDERNVAAEDFYRALEKSSTSRNAGEGSYRPIPYNVGMVFKYGKDKRSDVSSDTTFDAILAGERTSTLRVDGWKGTKDWAKVTTGDVVTFHDGNGRTVDVIVMDSLRVEDMSTLNAEQVSRTEGWTAEKLRRSYLPKKGGYYVQYVLKQPGLNNEQKTDIDGTVQEGSVQEVSGKGKGVDRSRSASSTSRTSGPYNRVPESNQSRRVIRRNADGTTTVESIGDNAYGSDTNADLAIRKTSGSTEDEQPTRADVGRFYSSRSQSEGEIQRFSWDGFFAETERAERFRQRVQSTLDQYPRRETEQEALIEGLDNSKVAVAEYSQEEQDAFLDAATKHGFADVTRHTDPEQEQDGSTDPSHLTYGNESKDITEDLTAVNSLQYGSTDHGLAVHRLKLYYPTMVIRRDKKSKTVTATPRKVGIQYEDLIDRILADAHKQYPDRSYDFNVNADGYVSFYYAEKTNTRDDDGGTNVEAAVNKAIAKAKLTAYNIWGKLKYFSGTEVDPANPDEMLQLYQELSSTIDDPSAVDAYLELGYNRNKLIAATRLEDGKRLFLHAPSIAELGRRQLTADGYSIDNNSDYEKTSFLHGLASISAEGYKLDEYYSKPHALKNVNFAFASGRSKVVNIRGLTNSYESWMFPDVVKLNQLHAELDELTKKEEGILLDLDWELGGKERADELLEQIEAIEDSLSDPLGLQAMENEIYKDDEHSFTHEERLAGLGGDAESVTRPLYEDVRFRDGDGPDSAVKTRKDLAGNPIKVDATPTKINRAKGSTAVTGFGDLAKVIKQVVDVAELNPDYPVDVVEFSALTPIERKLYGSTDAGVFHHVPFRGRLTSLIVVRTAGQKEGMTLAKVAHEVGHIIHRQYLAGLSPQTVSIIDKQLEKEANGRDVDEVWADKIGSWLLRQSRKPSNYADSVAKKIARKIIGFLNGVRKLMKGRFAASEEVDSLLNALSDERLFSVHKPLLKTAKQMDNWSELPNKLKLGVQKANQAAQYALGPRTLIGNLVRTLDTQMKSLGTEGKKIARLMWGSPDETDGTGNKFYMNLRASYTDFLASSWQNVTKGYTDEEVNAAFENLRQIDLIEGETPYNTDKLKTEALAQAGELEKKINKWLTNDTYSFLKRSITTLGRVKHYLPRLFDINAITANTQGFYQFLRSQGYSEDEANGFMDSLINNSKDYDIALHSKERDGHAQTGVGAQYKKLRSPDTAKFWQAAHAEGFMYTDGVETMHHYIEQMGRRAALEKVFSGHFEAWTGKKGQSHPLRGKDGKLDDNAAAKFISLADHSGVLTTADHREYDAIIGRMLLLDEDTTQARADFTAFVERMYQKALDMGWAKEKMVEVEYDFVNEEDIRVQGSYPAVAYDWYQPTQKLVEAYDSIKAGDPEAAQTFNHYLKAYFGRLGTDMPQHHKETLGWISTGVHYLTLALSTISSLPEPMLGAIRMGKMSDMFAATRHVFAAAKHEVARGEGRQRMYDLADILGLTVTSVTNNQIHEMYGMVYGSKTAQKASDMFFKYNGQHWFTNMSRAITANMALEGFIKNAVRGDAQWLAHFGLTPNEVLHWVENGRDIQQLPDNLRDGIHMFVNESVALPNAAMRPVWASNPYFAPLWALKSFMYAYGKLVTKPFALAIKNGLTGKQSVTPAHVYLAGIGLLMLPMAMFAWDLREMIQYDMWGDTPRSEKMDGFEYAQEAIRRTGILGQADIALALMTGYGSAEERVAGLVPAAEFVASLSKETFGVIDNPSSWTDPLFEATPVVRQLPGLEKLLTRDS